MSFSLNDVIKLFKEGGNKKFESFSHYFNSKESFELKLPENNLLIDSDIQEAILPIIRELLFEGKVIVFDISKNMKLKNIIYLYSKDLSGKSEIFMTNDINIFYTNVISLGE